jgi:signal recognition particle GTPase
MKAITEQAILDLASQMKEIDLKRDINYRALLRIKKELLKTDMDRDCILAVIRNLNVEISAEFAEKEETSIYFLLTNFTDGIYSIYKELKEDDMLELFESKILLFDFKIH